MSNDFKKPANALQSAQNTTEEDEFDFDIHFDQPISSKHLENAEDLHDFQLEHHDEETEDYDFDTVEEVNHIEDEETEDYDFDEDIETPEENLENNNNEVDETEAEDYEFDEDINDGRDLDDEIELEETEDYDFDTEESTTLADDIHNINGLSGVKMQSTESFSQQPQEETEDYDFDEDIETPEENLENNNNEVDETEDEDYDFDEDINDGHDLDDEIELEEDEDYDLDDEIEEDELELHVEEAIPTGSKIAQMIHSKKDLTQAKTPKINKLPPKPKKTLSHHIDLHRTKITLIAILILISALWAYASQVGVTTKSIPTFKDGVIKIIKTDGVQMQYTIREKLIFHESQTQITLNEFTKMEIDGTISLASGVFSSLQHNLQDATLTISDSKINITSTQNINISNTIIELVNREFAKMFKNVSISNTTIIFTNSDNKIVSNILIKSLEFTNSPVKSTIVGTIITNSKPVNINYSHTTKGNLLDATVKSSAFNFNINGTQTIFGTATKDSQTKGRVEFVVKDLEEFVKIFGGSAKITQSLARLPQATMQADVDYSSLNHELSITNGKLNVLNSVGKFSLTTTPDNYQAIVDFDNVSITEILERILTMFNQKSITKQQNSTQKKAITKNNSAKKTKGVTHKEHLLDAFSVISPAKPLLIQAYIRNISSKNENLSHNLATNVSITKNQIEMRGLTVEIGNNMRLEADGSINNLQTNPLSVLNIAITGNGDYKNIIAKTVQFLTHLQLAKELTEETSVIKITTLHKQPSTTINAIEIDIQDTISLQGSTQFTDSLTPSTPPSIFSNITISNTNLNNLKIDGISVPQGSTVFQDVINNNAQNTSSTLNIVNSRFKELTIHKATITKDTQKDLVSHKIDISTTDFLLQNSTTINIQKSVPEFQSTTVIQNVASFPHFHKVLQGIFENNTILLPSFEKIDGKIHLIMLQTKIFNKPFERIEVIGNLNQGILEIPETKLLSTDVDNAKPLSGKFSGTIDIRRSIPIFNLQATFVNAPMEEFKTILPFNANIGGTIFGGGSIQFSGTTYPELLETLKLKTKFVVQEASISNLNLDAVGQHLLKRQKNLEALNPEYIKNMFEQDGKTKASFIFSLTGDSKKFSIEDCTVKTAYAGGACYGNITINDNSKAAVEIIAKFALPALDINNGLKDIMKLYISSKIKQEGETCDITNDFSQINKYTSYRKTTFSS